MKNLLPPWYFLTFHFSLLHHFLRQDAFQLFAREANLQVALHGNGNTTRFLADDNSYAVGLLGDAKGSAMAQS